MNNVNTQVGTTFNLLGTDTVKAAVFGALDWRVDDYDVSAITDRFRAEINWVAPVGFALVGNIIFVDERADTDHLGASMADWCDAIDGIDFWSIVASHNNRTNP